MVSLDPVKGYAVSRVLIPPPAQSVSAFPSHAARDKKLILPPSKSPDG